MRGAILGVVALTATLFAGPSVAEPCSLAALGWMSGLWLSADDPKRAQERWAVAPGEILMGSSWEFPKGQPGFAEVMTIRPDGPAVSMFLRHFDGALSNAWEDKAQPIVFSASSCGPNAVVFDGQGDHVGERVTYTRSDDKLLIVGDFLRHGVPDHEEWRMVRAGS